MLVEPARGTGGGAASARLISSSRHDAPGVGVDAAACGPGARRSDSTTSAGSRSSTPTSDASTTSPSRVRMLAARAAGRCGRASRPTWRPSVRDHRGRPVPRLDERSRGTRRTPAARRAVERRVAPGRRDQHRQRVRQRAAAEHQQLEHRVERRGVATSARRRSGTASAGRRRSSSERSCGSRARIQLALPRTVLISPLCARKLNGCARSQVPSVLVEKRECTSAIARLEVGLAQVGVEGVELRARAAGPCRPACATRRLANVNAASATPRRCGRLLDAPADHVQLALERLGRRRSRRSTSELAHDRRGVSRASSPMALESAPARRASPGRGGPPRAMIRTHSSSQRRRTGRVVRQEASCRRRSRRAAAARARAPRARAAQEARRGAGSGCRRRRRSPGPMPVAPRWSRLRSTSTACATRRCDVVPSSCTSAPSPQASCSCRGS